MQAGQPSLTAFGAARHRAAHQILEQGRIFHDPLAIRILGTDSDTIERDANENPTRRRMRIFIACRHRFAEDALAAAIERGVTQVVVLGAGLDTWAYRNPFGVRVFEVDHPATQAWKRERLAESFIAIPDSLTYAPVNFESQTLAEGLRAAGFDRDAPTFFTWLGVVPYLTKDAIWSTLNFIASLPYGAHVVFDYANPPESFAAELRESLDQLATRVASIGETWLSFFHAPELRAKLLELGFTEVEDLGPPQIAARYFPARAGSAPEHGGHILRACSGSSTINSA